MTKRFGIRVVPISQDFRPKLVAGFKFTLRIDPVKRLCEVVGTRDGFPAYEIYLTSDKGAPVSAYLFDPGPVIAWPFTARLATNRSVRAEPLSMG